MYTVKRGMVFWFDSSRMKNDDKREAVIVDYSGTERRTKILNGRRPHIVISCDNVNKMGSYCTLVPSRTYMDGCAGDYSSLVNINGREGFVDVRHIVSVDQMEIDPKSFIGFLTDDELTDIDQCLINYLIGKPEPEQPSSHTLYMGVDVGSDVPVVSSSSPKQSPRKQKQRWTLSSAKEFMYDWDNNSVEYIMSKYGLISKKSVYSTRYNLVKKFGKHLVN